MRADPDPISGSPAKPQTLKIDVLAKVGLEQTSVWRFECNHMTRLRACCLLFIGATIRSATIIGQGVEVRVP
jgi:hypothetical protein